MRATLAKILHAASGDAPRPSGAGGAEVAMVPRGGGFLTRVPVPDTLPAWLSEADLDFYAGEFARTGFRGGLSWYRNIDSSWEPVGAVRTGQGHRSGALYGRRP